jgi:hypothetical protein
MNTPKMLRLGTVNDASSLSPTLQDCIEAALSITDSMVDEMFEALFSALDPERSGDLLSHEGVDAAVALRLGEQADAFKSTWHRQLRHVLYHGSELHAAASLAVRFDDLRRLDDRHIDASIGFALAEHEIEQSCADLLPRLNALVSSLMGWMTVQPDLNPLRPKAYAHALRASLSFHVADEAQRNALLMPMAGVLGRSLRQVYRELIQWLLVHGVEAIETGAALLPSQAAPRSAVGRTLLTLGRLRQLLAGDLNQPATDAQGFLHTLPLSLAALEDMDLVESLMKRLRERASPTEPVASSPELPVILEPNLGRLLGQEVVRLMLDNLTQDQRLLPPIRRQIGLMEPMLVRLSQVDPRFFSERQHPARQLLEEITERSLGYQSPQEPGFSDLLTSVVQAVRALERVPASEEVFERLLRRLRRRWEDNDAKKNRLRAEAARALLHAEQRHLLAERLSAEFQQQMQGQDIPDFVQRFLCGAWAQAVAESQLRGVPAEEGAEALHRVADELIWSAQAPLIRRDPERLVRLVPWLLQQLRQGLQGIEYPPELTGQFFDALVAVHEQAFERPPAPPAEPMPPVLTEVLPQTPWVDAAVPAPDAAQAPPAPAANDTSEAFWMAGSEVQDAGYMPETPEPGAAETVELGGTELTAGAWVDLLSQGEWVRAQLTWTSPHGSLFMFISAKGLAHSMTRRTLERLRNTGALRVVSTSGMVEGALDAVAQQAMHNQRRADGGG